MSQVTGQLVNMAAEAVAVLRVHLHQGRPADRVRAAHLVLTVGARLRHETELEVRLAEIERRLAATERGDEPNDAGGDAR